ncbi:hypothetical protein HYW94_03120 [Candidatus Uhrbacteria bacterium]|nr:hypothetical protein [Candidatus Uhrbacteria bacterium]
MPYLFLNISISLSIMLGVVLWSTPSAHAEAFQLKVTDPADVKIGTLKIYGEKNTDLKDLILRFDTTSTSSKDKSYSSSKNSDDKKKKDTEDTEVKIYHIDLGVKESSSSSVIAMPLNEGSVRNTLKIVPEDTVQKNIVSLPQEPQENSLKKETPPYKNDPVQESKNNDASNKKNITDTVIEKKKESADRPDQPIPLTPSVLEKAEQPAEGDRVNHSIRKDAIPISPSQPSPIRSKEKNVPQPSAKKTQTPSQKSGKIRELPNVPTIKSPKSAIKVSGESVKSQRKTYTVKKPALKKPLQKVVKTLKK